MNTPMSRFVLLALIWSAACASPEHVASDDSASIEDSEQALGAAQNNAPLLVLDSGHYSRYVYHGATSESFWVDLSVRNDSPQKEVGVLWTNDGWQTSHTTPASYEIGLSGGRERWGVDVRDFGGNWGPLPLEVEYAAFVKMNGQTYWSAFRNHYIYQVVTPSAPVRLLTSSVSLDGASEPVLSGVVRALTVPSPRRVFVRYTTDGWQSFADREASFDGKDFAFSAKLPFNPQSTEEVQYVVRLEAEGEIRWDNNAGANYRLRLAPAFASLGFQDDGTHPASGLRVLAAHAQTQLPVSQVWLRFDGGPRVTLPLFATPSYEQQNGFSSYGSVSYAFPVASFADGYHSVVVEVAAGPFVRSSAALGFEVDNSLAALSTWDLSSGETPWDLEVSAQGQAYVMRESQIDIYAALGALTPERVLVSPDPGRLLDLSVDEDGQVFASNGASVYRWLVTGERDTQFAGSGRLELNGSYAGRALCYAANIEAMQNYLYVVDSCNSRVLRFSFAGAFEAELDLSVENLSTNVTRVFNDGARLWVGYDTYADSKLHHQLVAISDLVGQAPAVVDSITLDDRVQNLDAFALASDGGVWATTGWQELYKLDQSGAVQDLWTGGGRLLTQPGAISIGAAVSVLADGSVAVLSVDTTKVERFGIAH